MGAIGAPEILLVLAVLLLLFGGKKLPQLARSMGRSMTEFRRGTAEPADAQDEGA